MTQQNEETQTCDDLLQTQKALVALSHAADVVSRDLHVIQPFLSVFIKHGDVIVKAHEAVER